MSEEIRVEKIKLSQLANYQSGTIVSNAVIKKPTGTVTVFAFDKGEGLSEHTAPFDAMVCLLDGSGEFTIDGERFVLEAGEAIIMPANIPHSVNAIEQFKMLLVMIRS